jgi:hypothetical protein
VVLIVAMLLGGNHGPGRHLSGPTVGASQLAISSGSLGVAERTVW